MKENDQTRFLRWGIPGWMMFLAFICYSAIDVLLSSDSNKNELLTTLTSIVNSLPASSTSSAIIAVLVAAAGIPLGFFIYQIYFYIRWNSPFSRDGLLPPFIVGRMNDLKRTLEGIKTEDISGNDDWRKAWTDDPLYEIDHGVKWRYIENYFIEIVQKLNSNQSGFDLYSRYRYLLDLMHTLGAGLFGIYIGYLSYLLIRAKMGSLSLTIILIINAFLLGGLFLILEREDSVRKNRDDLAHTTNNKYIVVKPIKKISFIQFSNPSAIYLFLCFAFLYLGSPSPYPVLYTDTHLIFRSVVLAVAVFMWVIPKTKYPKQIFWTELLALILSGGIAYFVSQWINTYPPFQVEWWSIGWSVLVFLLTNTFFIKNRQNTRDDLIAMQNYTIRRHIYLEKNVNNQVSSKDDTEGKIEQPNKPKKKGK